MTQIETAPRTMSFTEIEQPTERRSRLANAMSTHAFGYLPMVVEQHTSEPEADEDDGETIIRSYD